MMSEIERVEMFQALPKKCDWDKMRFNHLIDLLSILSN